MAAHEAAPSIQEAQTVPVAHGQQQQAVGVNNIVSAPAKAAPVKAAASSEKSKTPKMVSGCIAPPITCSTLGHLAAWLLCILPCAALVLIGGWEWDDK